MRARVVLAVALAAATTVVAPPRAGLGEWRHYGRDGSDDAELVAFGLPLAAGQF